MNLWRLSVVIAGALLLAFFCLLRAVDAQRPHGSDTEQIRALIAACDKAAARRDAAGVNRFISNDYKDGFGFRADQARVEIARVLGGARQVQVYVPLNSEVITVDPERHHAQASFDLQLATAGGRTSGLTFNGNLQLRLQKEPVRYYLVFPGEEWRITGANGYNPKIFQ